MFACKLSSLGPRAELLPQATEIRPRARAQPGRGACWHSVTVLRVSFLHAPFSFIFVDCSSGRPPTPWDPGCWSNYFYTRNWRTLVETGVTGAKKGIQKRHAKFNAEKVVNINAKRLPKWGQNGCWCGRGVPIAWFWKPKPWKYHQNGFQNLWNIEVAARMRFWSGFGSVFGATTDLDWPSLATILDQNSIKRHPKRHAKFDAEKVLKINGKRLPN